MKQRVKNLKGSEYFPYPLYIELIGKKHFGHYSGSFLCAGNDVIVTGLWHTTTMAGGKSQSKFVMFILHLLLIL